MVMMVVFPVPPVSMRSPIGGTLIPYVMASIVRTLIPHAGLATYHRRSCHDHWRRLDNYGSPYHYWSRGDHDRHRQSQPNGDVETSRLRS
jgi:hypothetical protein